jgi:hypothetical protein
MEFGRPSISEKSLGSNEPVTRESAPRIRKILTGWKEIANHINRGVRTTQRYESQFGLPIHRAGGKDRGAVMAFSDELDQWLNRSPVKNHRHVRRVLLVLDLPTQRSISNRKLMLEVSKFNVLTALSAEEFYETAEKFDVDGYVVDCPAGDSLACEICESLKERHPERPLFAIVAESAAHGDFPNADYLVVGDDAQKLLAAVVEVFGSPRVE